MSIFSIPSSVCRRAAVVFVITLLLSACAAKNMLFPGYTPPPKITDLINEQTALSRGLPSGAISLNLPEQQNNLLGQRSDDLISMQDYEYASNTISKDIENTLIAKRHKQPPQKFSPKYTYKSVQDYAAELAMQLIKNANSLQPSAAIGVSSFVKLDHSLQNTTVLGNQMSEYAISEIQEFGINVVDFKLMPAIDVRKNGDLAFSRDVMELAKSSILDHVVSGTMIERNDGVFVNARIIALGTNRVVSSASVLVPHYVVQTTTPHI